MWQSSALCLGWAPPEADHGTQAEAQARRFLREASRGLTAHHQPQPQALLRLGSMAGSAAETGDLSVPSRLPEQGTSEKQHLASKFLRFVLPRSGHTMLRKYSHSSTFHAAGGRASWQSCESTDLTVKTHPRNINSAGANPRPVPCSFMYSSVYARAVQKTIGRAWCPVTQLWNCSVGERGFVLTSENQHQFPSLGNGEVREHFCYCTWILTVRISELFFWSKRYSKH